MACVNTLFYFSELSCSGALALLNPTHCRMSGLMGAQIEA